MSEKLRKQYVYLNEKIGHNNPFKGYDWISFDGNFLETIPLQIKVIYPASKQTEFEKLCIMKGVCCNGWSEDAEEEEEYKEIDFSSFKSKPDTYVLMEPFEVRLKRLEEKVEKLEKNLDNTTSKHYYHCIYKCRKCNQMFTEYPIINGKIICPCGGDIEDINTK